MTIPRHLAHHIPHVLLGHLDDEGKELESGSKVKTRKKVKAKVSILFVLQQKILQVMVDDSYISVLNAPS